MTTTSGHAAPPIYTPPPLTAEDLVVLNEIHDMRREMAIDLRVPRRWNGGLRRNMLARAIRGSNSIEGIHVDEDDAAAALDDEEPLSADQRTWAEIRGYRLALGYVLGMANDRHFTYDTSALRSMHFMMTQHDLGVSPGQYRTGPIYVRDDKTGLNVYEGPESEHLPDLMNALTASLRTGVNVDPLVQAAMAHLNLVMIHPFRDGNGRMSRALQTLVLSRQSIAEPAFSSIEEWLGENTEDYYRALAITGQGHWQPRPDAHLWVSFNLRAHHMQAQTIARRIDEAIAIWEELDSLVAANGLPDRVTDQLYNAVLGYRIRRATYAKAADVEERTASRDLGRLADLGIITPQGETRGRHYIAGASLLDLRRRCQAKRRPLKDPYPWMRERLARDDGALSV